MKSTFKITLAALLALHLALPESAWALRQVEPAQNPNLRSGLESALGKTTAPIPLQNQTGLEATSIAMTDRAKRLFPTLYRELFQESGVDLLLTGSWIAESDRVENFLNQPENIGRPLLVRDDMVLAPVWGFPGRQERQLILSMPAERWRGQFYQRLLGEPDPTETIQLEFLDVQFGPQIAPEKIELRATAQVDTDGNLLISAKAKPDQLMKTATGLLALGASLRVEMSARETPTRDPEALHLGWFYDSSDIALDQKSGLLYLSLNKSVIGLGSRSGTLVRKIPSALDPELDTRLHFDSIGGWLFVMQSGEEFSEKPYRSKIFKIGPDQTSPLQLIESIGPSEWPHDKMNDFIVIPDPAPNQQSGVIAGLFENRVEFTRYGAPDSFHPKTITNIRAIGGAWNPAHRTLYLSAAYEPVGPATRLFQVDLPKNLDTSTDLIPAPLFGGQIFSRKEPRWITYAADSNSLIWPGERTILKYGIADDTLSAGLIAQHILSGPSAVITVPGTGDFWVMEHFEVDNVPISRIQLRNLQGLPIPMPDQAGLEADDAEALLEKFQNEGYQDLRSNAIARLAKIGSLSAAHQGVLVQALVGDSRDRSKAVRMAIMRNLHRLGVPIEEILSILKDVSIQDTNESLRHEANVQFKILSKQPELVDAVIQFLRQEASQGSPESWRQKAEKLLEQITQTSGLETATEMDPYNVGAHIIGNSIIAPSWGQGPVNFVRAEGLGSEPEDIEITSGSRGELLGTQITGLASTVARENRQSTVVVSFSGTTAFIRPVPAEVLGKASGLEAQETAIARVKQALSESVGLEEAVQDSTAGLEQAREGERAYGPEA